MLYLPRIAVDTIYFIILVYRLLYKVIYSNHSRFKNNWNKKHTLYYNCNLFKHL